MLRKRGGQRRRRGCIQREKEGLTRGANKRHLANAHNGREGGPFEWKRETAYLMRMCDSSRVRVYMPLFPLFLPLVPRALSYFHRAIRHRLSLSKEFSVKSSPAHTVQSPRKDPRMCFTRSGQRPAGPLTARWKGCAEKRGKCRKRERAKHNPPDIAPSR